MQLFIRANMYIQAKLMLKDKIFVQPKHEK